MLKDRLVSMNVVFWLVLFTESVHVTLTGTPQGVGPVRVGQKIDAGITGLLDVHFEVERRQAANYS